MTSPLDTWDGERWLASQDAAGLDRFHCDGAGEAMGLIRACGRVTDWHDTHRPPVYRHPWRAPLKEEKRT